VVNDLRESPSITTSLECKVIRETIDIRIQSMLKRKQALSIIELSKHGASVRGIRD
jgi:hypothetical protein